MKKEIQTPEVLEFPFIRTKNRKKKYFIRKLLKKIFKSFIIFVPFLLSLPAQPRRPLLWIPISPLFSPRQKRSFYRPFWRQPKKFKHFFPIVRIILSILRSKLTSIFPIFRFLCRFLFNFINFVFNFFLFRLIRNNIFFVDSY